MPSYEEKLWMWRLARQRVRDEQWAQNERDAKLVEKMSDDEVYAQQLADYGSPGAVERKSEMTRQDIHRVIQSYHPTRH